MTGVPGRLVLVGHPVQHSLSPTFQNAALAAAALPLRYEALDVLPAELRRTVDALRAVAAAGNVTIPHKVAFGATCDELSTAARRAGAVNTFWMDGDRLVGDNTDVDGFTAAVAKSWGLTNLDRCAVALIGAGGSAAAVATAAEAWPARHVRVFSRRLSQAVALCRRFPNASAADSLDEALAGADLAVNATPIGQTDDAMPFDPRTLRGGSAVIDLVYRRGETALVRSARNAGLSAADGRTMLLEQGILAFERWFGFPPNRAAMTAALAEALTV